MKPIFIILIIVVVLGTILYYRIKPLSATVTIRETTFVIELALSAAEKMKGLSGRSNLPTKHGMLFLYDHKERFPFTMIGMNFPLDFVWLDGNVILDISKNVAPGTPMILPSVPIDKILELNAGELDSSGIKVGDTALFNK
jgi:hypothetical protein